MARLVDVSALSALPRSIALEVQDLLLVRATGGALLVGDAVEPLGVFGAAVLGPEGNVICASGGPDAVVFLARRCGSARIEIIRGAAAPVRPPPTVIDIVVGP